MNPCRVCPVRNACYQLRTCLAAAWDQRTVELSKRAQYGEHVTLEGDTVQREHAIVEHCK